jgi:hypothetical protein
VTGPREGGRVAPEPDARVSPPRDPVVIDGGDRACVRLLLLELRARISGLPAGTVIHLIASDPAAPASGQGTRRRPARSRHDKAQGTTVRRRPPGEDTEYEPGNNKMAWGDTPPKFSHHLLEPVDVIQVADTNWWLTFQRLAKGGTRGIDTLARVPEPRVAVTYAAIVKPLLSGWAQWAHVPSMRVSDFVSRQLDKRIGPKGQVRAWASSRPELLEDPVPWIEIADEKLPNPFALVTGSSFDGH